MRAGSTLPERCRPRRCLVWASQAAEKRGFLRASMQGINRLRKKLSFAAYRKQQGLKPSSFHWALLARLKPCPCYKAWRIEFFSQPLKSCPVTKPLRASFFSLFSPGHFAGLNSRGFSLRGSCYPSGGGIGAVVGACIEGNCRIRGSLADSVDDDFQQCKVARGQAHAGSDDNTIVVRRRQMMLHCGSGGLVRAEKNRVGLPSAVSELLERNRNAGVNLLSS